MLIIVGIRPTAKTTVTGVEMFRKLLDSGQAGDNIGALSSLSLPSGVGIEIKQL